MKQILSKIIFALALLALALLFSPLALLADIKTVLTGTGVEIGVTADGTQPFTYQWSKNGVLIPGATGAKLVFASPTPADTGRYTAKVSNIAGSTVSDEAVLTVNDPVLPPANARTTTVVTVTVKTDAAGKVVIDVKAQPAP